MGTRTPADQENKEAILADAEADRYRGRYLEFGGIDYISVGIGFCCGLAAALLLNWIAPPI